MSNETKHTPRPWTLVTDDDVISQLIGNGTVFIAEIYNIDFPAASKDAHLIAAAPELLECCKLAATAIHSQVESVNDLTSIAIDTLRTLRAVIARAEGRHV